MGKQNKSLFKNPVLIILSVIILLLIIYFGVIVPYQKKQENVNLGWGEPTESSCLSIANSHFNKDTKQCDCNQGYEVDWATFNCKLSNK